MKVQIFKSSRANDLNADVQRFIDEDPTRELRDVKVAYGVSTADGMLDERLVVAVLYDVREPEALEARDRRLSGACA